MSELKKIRELKNLTQEELAAQSGISVRTIQRIEAGTDPKGYTLKTLAATLDISEKDLLKLEIQQEIFVENSLPTAEKNDVLNYTLIKMINLSSIPFAWFPIVNFLPPLLIMLFTKEKSEMVKQIISLQIFLAIISPIIFLIVAVLKLGSPSVMITMIVLTLSNIYIILRNAYEIDKRKILYYKLNFNII
ncbi:helix-turn-helix domain-containing protein [Chryseobacterium wangxinyae]|uniref:helix-turn-helix domain-containing protein n=1 Tax=Chryseobacterium sp. CY353 TaxID=2997334 RepID=UPI0022711678|nr:helix-turn-helix domain-containing protein [Chryseobacterium sp. CY353]MCY0967554.1 helix-turn-helix domain-containing protein [Chryseobacterium sp. CY353]